METSRDAFDSFCSRKLFQNIFDTKDFVGDDGGGVGSCFCSCLLSRSTLLPSSPRHRLSDMLKCESGTKVLVPKQSGDGEQRKPDQSRSENFVRQRCRVDVEVFVASPCHEGDVNPLQGRVHAAERRSARRKSPSHQRAVYEDDGGRGRRGTTSESLE